MLSRKTTNFIRSIMDNWIPPIVRDTKYFMWPFFYLAYKGNNIKQAMNFKRLVYTFTDKEYEDFYRNLKTFSESRPTDLSRGCIDYMINNIDKKAKNLIDVGCGDGYFIDQVYKKRPHLGLFGSDIKKPKNNLENFSYKTARIEKLPFKTNQFDVVCCSQTLEHIIDIKTAINELIRIAKHQLMVVVPRQRYYYYTLDTHVNFFPYKERLTTLFDLKDITCVNIDGDWVLIGKKK